MKVFLIGMPGSGKSTVGKTLAEKLKVPFSDMDELIVARANAPIGHIFEAQGEEVFRELEREVLVELCEKPGSLVVSTGGGAPCFFDNLKLMNAKGKTIYLKSSLDKLMTNLKGSESSRPLLKGNLRSNLESLMTRREGIYIQSLLTIDGEPSADKVVELVLRAIKN